MSEIEIWKDVPGYNGFYKISNKGRIKSVKRARSIHGKIIIVEKERELIPYIHTEGYLKINLHQNGKTKSFYMHRLLMQTFKPGNGKLTINHIDGNKQNNNLNNLEWVTQKENVIHALETGLNKRRKKVICLDTGVIYKSVAECARKNNVKQSGISGACNGIYKTIKGKRYEFYEGVI